MKRFICLGMMFLSSVGFAKTPEEIRQQIKNKMSERHPENIDGFWSQFGTDALPVLQKLYSESQTPFERAWLMDGMSRFDDPAVAEALKKTIRTEDQDVLRRKAVSGLVRSQGEKALEFVEPYLKDPDPQMRQATAQAIQRFASDSARGRDRIRRFLDEEPLAWVKTQVNQVAPGSSGAQTMKLKREESIYSETPPARPLPSPLPPADWAGNWKGVWMQGVQGVPAQLKLQLLNRTALEKKDSAPQIWRLELKVPKKSRQELAEKDYDWATFVTPKGHWLELRSKKTDAVFIGHQPVKSTP